MCAARAERFTIKTKQIEVYTDFYLNFDLNPVTGFLAKVTNEDSVKQSIKTLLLTRRGERFYDVTCGSRLHGLLYEPMDSVTESNLKLEITETLQNNEHRIDHLEVSLSPDEDNNAYNVSIFFSIINIPNQQFTLNLVLERVR